MQIQLQLTPRRRKGAVVNRSGLWPFDTVGSHLLLQQLPPPLPLHHAAGEADAPEVDAPGPGIPGRLKSQHPQIPQQEKTINQLFLDGLLMIKALSSPQHCDSDSSAFRESGLAATSPACGRSLVGAVARWDRAQHSHPFQEPKQLCAPRGNRHSSPAPPCCHTLPLTGEFPVSSHGLSFNTNFCSSNSTPLTSPLQMKESFNL